MNLFENKNYQSIIFLVTSIALLLIFFNSTKIFEGKNFESITNKIIQENKNYKITGFATEEPKNKTAEKDRKTEKEEKLYSEKSYTIYYVILIILVMCIVITSLAYFLPLIRDYT